MATLGELKVEITGDASSLNRSIDNAKSTVQNAGRKLESAGKTLTKTVTGPIVAAGAAAVKSFADLETAWTNVEKVLDGSQEQLQGVRSDLEQITKELPATTEEVFGAAEAAGRLGVEAQNVEEFTRVMIDMGNATNLHAQEAADVMARFGNIMGTEMDQMRDLGNVIVQLGNNFATTEQEILDIGKRVARAGTIIGLTEDEVLGLSAAMKSLGIRSESGGTAMQRAFQSMNSAVQEGGKNLETFAEIAGTSAQEFAETFRKDASQAVIMFLEGLGAMQREGKATSSTLKALGLGSQQTQATLTSLAGSTDEVRKAWNMAASEMENGNALATEAERVYGTLNSELKSLWSTIKITAAQFGDNLAPIVERTSEHARSLAEDIGALSEDTQSLIIGLGTLAGSFGPVLIVIGKVVTALGGLSTVVTGLVGGGGAIAALAGAAGLVVDNWESIINFFSGLREKLAGPVRTVVSTIEQLWNQHGSKVVGMVGSIATNIINAIVELGSALKTRFEQILNVVIGVWRMWGDSILNLLENTFNQWVNTITTIGQVFEEVVRLIAGIVKGDWSAVWDSFTNIVGLATNWIIETLANWADTVLGLVKDAFGWADPINNAITSAQNSLQNFIDSRVQNKVEKGANNLETSVTTAVEGAEKAAESSKQGMTTVWEQLRRKSAQVFSPESAGSVSDNANKAADSISRAAEKMRKNGLEPMETSMEKAGQAQVDLEKKAQDIVPLYGDMEVQFGKTEEALKKLDQELSGPFTEAARNAEKAIKDKFNVAIEDSVDAIWEGESSLGGALSNVGDSMIELAEQGVKKLIVDLITGDKSLKGAFQDIVGTAKGVMDVLSGDGGLGGIISNIGGKIGELVGSITGEGGLGGLFSDLGSKISGLGSSLSTTIPIAGAFASGIDDWSSVLSGGSSKVGGLIEKITGLGKTTSNVLSMGGPIGTALGAGAMMFKAFGVDVNKHLQNAAQFVKDGIGKIGSFIGGLFGGGGGGDATSSDLFDKMEGFFGGWEKGMEKRVLGTMKSVGKEMGTNWEQITKSLLDMAKKGMVTQEEIANNTEEVIRRAAERTEGHIVQTGGALGKLQTEFDGVITSIEQGWQEGWKFAQDWNKKTKQEVASVVKDARSRMKEVEDTLRTAYEEGKISAREFQMASSQSAQRLKQEVVQKLKEMGVDAEAVWERISEAQELQSKKMKKRVEESKKDFRNFFQDMKKSGMSGFQALQKAHQKFGDRSDQELKHLRSIAREVFGDMTGHGRDFGQDTRTEIDRTVQQGEEGFNRIGQRARESFSNVEESGRQAMNTAREEFSRFEDAASRDIDVLTTNTREGYNSMAKKTKNFTQHAKEKIDDFRTSASNDFSSVENDASTHISNIEDTVRNMSNNASEAVGNFRRNATDTFDKVRNRASQAANKVRKGFDNAAKAASNALKTGRRAQNNIPDTGGGGARSMQHGGLAFGETLAKIGDYASSVNNPEVVAPLSDLKSILRNSIRGDIGSGRRDMQQTVIVRLDGRTIARKVARDLPGVLEVINAT